MKIECYLTQKFRVHGINWGFFDYRVWATAWFALSSDQLSSAVMAASNIRWYLSSIWSFSWWNPFLCSSLIGRRFSGNFSMRERWKCIFNLMKHPSFWKASIMLLICAVWFDALVLFRKVFNTCTKDFHAALSTVVIELWNSVSFMSCSLVDHQKYRSPACQRLVEETFGTGSRNTSHPYPEHAWTILLTHASCVSVGLLSSPDHQKVRLWCFCPRY